LAQNGGISSFLHRSILRAITTLVFSYSHADEALRNELEKHLSPLKRTGKITTWHDRRIVPGQEFERKIDHYFSQADIILILISSDFIASDYCYQVEMKNALERHDRGEAVVIPVILRNCAWHQLEFGSIMAATIDGKPITKFATHDTFRSSRPSRVPLPGWKPKNYSKPYISLHRLRRIPSFRE